MSVEDTSVRDRLLALHERLHGGDTHGQTELEILMDLFEELLDKVEAQEGHGHCF